MNQFTRWIWMSAGLAVFGAALTLMTEGRAVAQAVRAALVRNQDEPGRNPYTEQQVCNAFNCNLTFAPVPAGQRLVLTSVNFALLGVSGSPLVVLNGPGTQVRLIPGTMSGPFQVGNVPVVAYFDAGQQPALECATVPCGNSGFEAVLSGYFITLP